MPLTYDDCLVEPLMDGVAYNAALVAALNTVGRAATPQGNRDNGDFVFIANWWLALVGGRHKLLARFDYARHLLDPSAASRSPRHTVTGDVAWAGGVECRP